MKNMQLCCDKYITEDFLKQKDVTCIVDVGSMDICGSYRKIFVNEKIKYIGVDLSKGVGVDIVLENPYKYPFLSESIDVVVSGQTFEHCEFFWEAFREMVRVLRSGGYLFLIAPSAGFIHRFPVDCYRFHPDSYNALAKYGNVSLVEQWMETKGRWKDLVGVFKK